MKYCILDIVHHVKYYISYFILCTVHYQIFYYYIVYYIKYCQILSNVIVLDIRYLILYIICSSQSNIMFHFQKISHKNNSNCALRN